MQFTIADGAVALVVLISALLAYNRGFTREALAIGGWIAAGFVGLYFAPFVSPLVLETPYVGSLLQGSCTLTALAAFVIVFAIALLVLSIFTPLLSSAVQGTVLGPIDKGLGFIFGVARGVILVAVVYLLYDLVVTDGERLAMIDQSASITMIGDAADRIRANAPTSIPDFLQGRIDQLLGDCVGATNGDSASLVAPDAAA